MDKIMDHEALGALFELNHDAVVGVKETKICFANPAATSLFGLSVGGNAEDLLPAELLDGVSYGATKLRVNERTAAVSVRRFDDYTLLYLQPTDSSMDRDPFANWLSLRSLSDTLTGTRMALDALFKYIPPENDPDVAKYASILYRNYFRLRRLHGHTIAAKSLQDGTLTCASMLVDLEKTLYELTDSVSALTRTLGVEFCFESTGRDFITVGDRDLLEVMVLNLFSNSLLHCERGGRICVGLRHNNKTGFIISVDDDGSGMNDSALIHAFSGQAPLELSGDHVGIGYGLAIAKGIAEKHGGVLLIDSHAGQGCRVRISLPRKRPNKTMLNRNDPTYDVRDMSQLLTELSVVLPTDCYQEKYLD